MDKINIPQAFISYPGGATGEWLAYQIGQHDKYYAHHQGELQLDINEYNRCRITGSWRQTMLDDTDVKDETWTETEYDGSAEWWKEFWFIAPSPEDYYDEVRRLVEWKPRFRIGVHRSHEAWYDQYWADLFEEFKTVTIRVNRDDPDSFAQFKGNIIKKIWWQDLSNEQDLCDEMFDKYRKLYKRREQKGQPEDLLEITRKFSGDVNYTDMMFALYLHEFEDADRAIECVQTNMSGRWNDYNVKQHHRELPNQVMVDFGGMFVRNSYDEYINVVKHLGLDAMTPSEWSDIITPFTDVDKTTLLTEADVYARLKQRASEC